MNFIPSSSVSLQAVLAQGSADISLQDEYIGPHHPITCQNGLALEEDGTLLCDHSKADPGHPRTQAVVDASIAILILEEAFKKFR